MIRPLHQVKVAVVFQALGVEQLRAKPGVSHPVGAVAALIGQIVNREEDPRTLPEGVIRQAGLEVNRNRRRGPVVTMHHVGPPARARYAIERGLAEKTEALGIVVVFVRPVVVDPAAPEVMIVFHQVKGNLAVRKARLPETAVRRVAPEMGGANAPARRFRQTGQAAVEGQHDAHIVPRSFSAAALRRHVRKPAGHHQRRDFRRHKQDFQGWLIPSFSFPVPGSGLIFTVSPRARGPGGNDGRAQRSVISTGVSSGIRSNASNTSSFSKRIHP